jgi:hypothetical protein
MAWCPVKRSTGTTLPFTSENINDWLIHYGFKVDTTAVDLQRLAKQLIIQTQKLHLKTLSNQNTEWDFIHNRCYRQHSTKFS